MIPRGRSRNIWRWSWSDSLSGFRRILRNRFRGLDRRRTNPICRGRLFGAANPAGTDEPGVGGVRRDMEFRLAGFFEFAASFQGSRALEGFEVSGFGGPSLEISFWAGLAVKTPERASQRRGDRALKWRESFFQVPVIYGRSSRQLAPAEKFAGVSPICV